MKKAVLIALMAVLLIQGVLAGGTGESGFDSNAGTAINASGSASGSASGTVSGISALSAASTRSVLADLVTGIGATLGELTVGMATSIHPFPGILSQFYTITPSLTAETNATASEFSMSEDLLISGGFRTSPVIGDGTAMAEYNAESIARQPRRWRIITTLFITLFTAEVLFFSIWSYVTGKDTFLFKELVTKIAMCFLIFILCSSLPYLLEAVRYGLTRLAEVFVTGDAVSADYNMLLLPSTFLNRMAILMDFLDPSYGGADNASLVNNQASSVKGFFSNLFTALIYLLFKFFMVFELLKAGLHIFINTIEVYFLLTVVMLLMPFTVFTPTKSFGEKCVLSLFNNLIECFILLLIVIVIIPATLNASSGLLGTLLAENYKFKSIAYAGVRNVSGTRTDGTSFTGWYNATSSSAYSQTNELNLDDIHNETTFSVNHEGVLAYYSGSVGLADNDSGKGVCVANVLFVAYYTSGNSGDSRINDNFLKLQEATMKNSDYIIVTCELPKTATAGSGYASTPVVKTGGKVGSLLSDKSDPRLRISLNGFYDGVDLRSGGTYAGASGNPFSSGLYLDFGLWYSGVCDIFTQTMSAMSQRHIQNAEGGQNFSANDIGSMYSYLTLQALGGLNYHTGTQDSVIALLETIINADIKSFYSGRRATAESVADIKDGVSSAAESTLSAADRDNRMLRHIIIMFVCLYIPCYMVQQSSQITQALMQGSVGFESFSNSLSQQAHGWAKAGIGAVATVAGMAGKAAFGMLSGGKPGGGGSGGGDTMQGNLPPNGGAGA